MTKNKLKLDLYNRRFEIYTRVLNYCNLFMMGDSKGVDYPEKKINFIVAFRESNFLFESNSGIYEIIKDLMQTCSFIEFYHANEKGITFDNNKHDDVISKQNSIEEKLITLEKAMSPYLKFGLLSLWHSFIMR